MSRTPQRIIRHRELIKPSREEVVELMASYLAQTGDLDALEDAQAFATRSVVAEGGIEAAAFHFRVSERTIYRYKGQATLMDTSPLRAAMGVFEVSRGLAYLQEHGARVLTGRMFTTRQLLDWLEMMRKRGVLEEVAGRWMLKGVA